MSTVFFDSPVEDQVRRQLLYGGEIFVFSPRPASLALCRLADQLIREAFGDLDPERAQYSMPVEKYAAVLSELKPRFIHHPQAKECIKAILSELGCDLGMTYFDVPRMRSSTSDDFLTTGIAYAWHPHRDTWYSAPQCQINWWLPIYAIDGNNGLAFHPRYWKEPIKNDSSRYNYYQWNKEFRANAAQFIKADTRPLPRPVEPIAMEPQIRPICPPGGLILFAGAQVHSSVPNTSGKTRFSIDFRTVNLDDLRCRVGAPNIDSSCTGTALRDYLRGTDLSRVPDEVVGLYDDGTGSQGELIYQANLDA